MRYIRRRCALVAFRIEKRMPLQKYIYSTMACNSLPVLGPIPFNLFFCRARPPLDHSFLWRCSNPNLVTPVIHVITTGESSRPLLTR